MGSSHQFDTQLDYNIIVERIQKHKEGYDLVGGQDIVFFVGNTGAGKTTSILYLAGKVIEERMVKVKVGDEEVEDFKLCCAEAMTGFVIGHNDTSETIAANAYQCPLSGLTFVDFAGQIDTSGHEIDIANTVGLYNTLARARSVRLVLVVDFNSVETLKGQILRKSIEFISGFVPNLNDTLDSLVVLFTHNAIVSRLKVKLQSIKQANAQSAVSAFLDHLISFVGKNGDKLLVDPLDPEKREATIGVIKASTPILTNSSSFKFFLPSDSRMLLIDKLKDVHAIIQHNLRLYSWKLVEQHMEDLHLLSTEMSMMQEVVEIYESAKRTVVKAAQELVAKVHTMLELGDFKAVANHLKDIAKTGPKLRELVKSQVDIEKIYKEIRDIINSRIATLASEIDTTESYILVRQKLDLVKAIASHLQSYLTDTNKAVADKVEHKLQERVKQQNKDILSQINSLSKEGNYFVEAKENYLTEILSNNLTVLAEVDKLFDGCTHYQSASEALSKAVENHHTKFIALLANDPPPPELQLSFKVLKEFHKSQSLLAHASPDSQLLFSKTEKAFLQALQEMNKAIGSHSVNYDFVPIASMLVRVNLLVQVDPECCAQFVTESITTTITQMQTLVTNLITDVQKKADEELNASSVAGCQLISEKAAILQRATKVESAFTNTTLVSTFLAAIRDAYLTKARQLLNTLEESLSAGSFGDSPQGREICTLLQVGIIPEAVQQFVLWGAKFQQAYQEVERQTKRHMQNSLYSDLAVDFQLLGSLQQFNSAFMQFKPPSEPSVFSVIGTTIITLKESIIDKLATDWRQYHEQFVAQLKLVVPPLTGTHEQMKTTLVSLIQKLKEINDTNMEQHLGALKPSVALTLITKTLKSNITAAESESRAMIAAGHLDNAEKYLPVVDILCEVLGYLDTVEGVPLSNLTSSLRERRLNMTQQIPEKLQRYAFTQVTGILQNMQGAAGELERKEFDNMCVMVDEFFADLVSSVRCTTIESVHAAVTTLNLFTRAACLDTAFPDLGIAAKRAKVTAKIRGYTDKNVRQFKQLLADCKFSEAYAIVVTFEELTDQNPDIPEFTSVNFRAEIEKFVSDMPKSVKSILDNGKWNSINKIDKFIEQLENVKEKLGIDVDDVITAIEELVNRVVKQKDANITKYISEFKIEEASDELYSLELLVELKCLAPFKAKGIVKKRNEDLESSRRAQFSWDLLHHNPVKLSEDLFAVKQHSYSSYSERLGSIEKNCNELATSIDVGLDNISSGGGMLRQLAANLECYSNIAVAFTSKHESFAKKLNDTLNNKLLPKLHSICNIYQNNVQKDIRSKQWENAEHTLKAMEMLGKELEKFVPKDFLPNISNKVSEMQSTATATVTSTKFLKNINLFEPINIDAMVENLTRLKDNASTRLQIASIPDFESYEEVVSKILHETDQKEKVAKKHFEEGKYEPVACFLENLQQADKFVKHEALIVGFTERYRSLTRTLADYVADLEKKAEKLFKEGKLAQLEDIQKVHAKIFARFGMFREIFRADKNNVVDMLFQAVTQLVKEFSEKFAGVVPTIEEAVAVLLQLKAYSSNISSATLAPHVHGEMNNLLNFLVAKKDFEFLTLGNQLRDSGALGRDIVEGDNFPQFKAVVIALMNDVIARMTPADALAALAKRNNWTNFDHLQSVFGRYNACFDSFLEKYLLASTEEVDAMVQHTRSLFEKKDWKSIKDSFPVSLAAVFAVWSLNFSKSFYQESKNMKSVLRPHPIQVLTILCMLGMDTPSEANNLMSTALNWFGKITGRQAKNVQGHLVQIGTGEGKSVVLGILSTVLALLGFDVSCACYSTYLSERDYQAFSGVFAQFGVSSQIRYSTLAQLAGNYINEQGDIRQFTNQFLEGQRFTSNAKPATRPKVLLIDEVDTFLSRDFYGATYNPCTILRNENVNFVLEYIWKHQDCTLSTVRDLEGYKALATKYKHITQVLEGAVQRMIAEVRKYNDPPYYCAKNKLGQMVLGYKENGTISTAIQHGYRTCFAYLHARDKGAVTKEIAAQNLGLTINCGQFSYAEIPREYECILGVTGTLETLCNFEKKVKNEDYKIDKETYTPSIYGDSRLSFQQVEDVFVMSDMANYHLQLQDSIMKRQKAGQPVLVFFENELELDTFAASNYCKTIPHLEIKENTENIDFYIRKATRINETSKLPEVTFLPRVFGRGLDFACRDDRINTERGIHVIQTFLSEDVSEEIQIKGRTARQGKPGTYCLILNIDALKKQFAITMEQVNERKNAAKLYEFLHQTRVAQFERKSEDRKGIVDRSKQLHDESVQYRTLFGPIKDRDPGVALRINSEITRFLESQNPVMKPKSRIVCLSDATGSMSSVWSKAKSQVVEMVKRIITIGGAGKSELMWVAYRDYGDTPLIENSEWSSDPAVLSNFINKIKCTGGGGDGPEAVEIALQQANSQPNVTRVILIADAPPHFELKGTICKFFNVKMTTDYHEQASMLAAKKIPVYCFYMEKEPALISAFEEIAKTTGGKAALFSNANTLIDIVAENVLDDIGGDEMVLEYRKTYHS